jgi:hypothetical protein
VVVVTKEKEGFELHYDKEVAFPFTSIDPIIVDSTDSNEDFQRPIEKENRIKDPKRAARIILSILLSIMVLLAGILGGIYLMRVNASDGSTPGAIYFLFIAIVAIALMLLAALIALFLLISVFSAP